ncbi:MULTISPECIES: ParB N-terminal domain-containing protein [unclassified Pseudoalteromonas]|uniref:ParB N-terminal domain-containing protein n=1 Tax=unclassified Pseudoalteromonas TaxID=194690 RepID=UPI003014C156
MSKYEWLERKVLRSVDQLRLWPDNPRLSPEEKHVSVQDFVSDLISDNGEKDDFFKLVDSIASDGFIPADPVVVWQSDNNDKYYVAEGNRRVLALKLLRSPDKAPRSIRSYIRRKAELIDRDTIEKIRVCVAPSLDDCEWYINQRHAVSTQQRSWSRLQQQRWIAGLYDKYEGDITKVSSVTKLNKGQLEYTLRILNVRDLALNPIVMAILNEEEREKVTSHRIPMTILERWFFNPKVKESWGIEFDGTDIKIMSNQKSFFMAYAQWLKNVFSRGEPNVDIKIDTRTITAELEELLEKLPTVSFEVDDEDDTPIISLNNTDKDASTSTEDEKPAVSDEDSSIKRPLNKNPDRNQLVVETCVLSTSNYKLDALFREFKKLPIYKYKNTTAASLRVFLDLAVAEYINSIGAKEELCTIYKGRPYQEITLKHRLEFMKKEKLTKKTPAYKVVEKLLNSSNEHSLDTLNNYIHGTDQQHTNKRFLNGFWDFLFPLFEEIIGMTAK